MASWNAWWWARDEWQVGEAIAGVRPDAQGRPAGGGGGGIAPQAPATDELPTFDHAPSHVVGRDPNLGGPPGATMETRVREAIGEDGNAP